MKNLELEELLLAALVGVTLMAYFLYFALY